MEELIPVSKNTINEAMYAIQKLQRSLGIDLSDEDEGFGYVYFALERALQDAEQ